MSVALDITEVSLNNYGAAAIYAIVIGFIFIECGLLAGLLLPGDSLLFAAGLVAGAETSTVNVLWLTVGVFLAAITGECVGYVFGWRTGMALLSRRNGRILNQKNLVRAESFYRRYGVLAIVSARWVPWVRTFAPILAGAARMPWHSFMLANVVGALTWAPVLISLGYFAGSVPVLKHVSLALAVTAVMGALLIGILRYRSTTRSLDDRERGASQNSRPVTSSGDHSRRSGSS